MDNVRTTAIDILNNSTFLFVLILVVFVVALVLYINSFIPFIRERNYILSEINRTSGRERRSWERRLKRLYLRCIPIIGPVLARLIKEHHRHHH